MYGRQRELTWGLADTPLQLPPLLLQNQSRSLSMYVWNFQAGPCHQPSPRSCLSPMLQHPLPTELSLASASLQVAVPWEGGSEGMEHMLQALPQPTCLSGYKPLPIFLRVVPGPFSLTWLFPHLPTRQNSPFLFIPHLLTWAEGPRDRQNG